MRKYTKKMMDRRVRYIRQFAFEAFGLFLLAGLVYLENTKLGGQVITESSEVSWLLVALVLLTIVNMAFELFLNNKDPKEWKRTVNDFPKELCELAQGLHNHIHRLDGRADRALFTGIIAATVGFAFMVWAVFIGNTLPQDSTMTALSFYYLIGGRLGFFLFIETIAFYFFRLHRRIGGEVMQFRQEQRVVASQIALYAMTAEMRENRQLWSQETDHIQHLEQLLARSMLLPGASKEKQQETTPTYTENLLNAATKTYDFQQSPNKILWLPANALRK